MREKRRGKLPIPLGVQSTECYFTRLGALHRADKTQELVHLFPNFRQTPKSFWRNVLFTFLLTVTAPSITTTTPLLQL